jgi:hypothetical protein
VVVKRIGSDKMTKFRATTLPDVQAQHDVICVPNVAGDVYIYTLLFNFGTVTCNVPQLALQNSWLLFHQATA